MEEMDSRFETFPDPLNNWIVWDREKDDFARVEAHQLRSLGEADAIAFCHLLNRLRRGQRCTTMSKPNPAAPFT
jgi:hypothetical protein